ncbi:MAG: tRNA pseudouridine(38-40) synthase TruA [Alphaproteobacteria bacterium]|nr:tRNA pseudouridine(38-40) synthase TruA [Alphaproteobacteria bacterium]
MPRYKLTIEYDGGPYQGWQRLGAAPSVQGALEDAVEKLCGVRTDVVGAGRTDSGVHALAQVAHVDLPKSYDVSAVRDALNAHLRPHPIAVIEAEEADAGFHARFDAIKRRYWYRIINRRADLALDRGKAWRVVRPLDAEAMDAAAQALVGDHDFTTFRDSACQAKSPQKTLDEIHVVRAGDEVHVHVEARSFLHRQVRSITGTLVEVGLGKQPVSWVARALAARDRAACGPVAPADGLYLVRVGYAAGAK